MTNRVQQVVPVYGDVRIKTTQGYELVVRGWALLDSGEVRPLAADKDTAALQVFDQDDTFVSFVDYLAE